MYVKVFELNKCCFCLPLRSGIIIFGFINLIFSIITVASLVVITELRGKLIFLDFSLEVVTSVALFCIFGMGAILNILLLIAGCQEDVLMLRLYNYYALATTLAALCPTIILLWRMIFIEAGISLFVIAMQFYIIILVRSMVVKLEKEHMNCDEEYQQADSSEAIVTPETETLV